MDVEHITREQIWQNETTNYWFNVDGTRWGLSDHNGVLSLIDCDGYCVDACNDFGGIKSILIDRLNKFNTQFE